MNSILAKIARVKKEEVTYAKQHRPLSYLRDNLSTPIRDFIGRLQCYKPAIIAEIKKASPIKGVIRADFDVETIAKIYEKYGAACLSVLTDNHFFQGDLHYIALAKEHSTLPVLRKDFIIDEYQITESRALGADCILLIVALLDDWQLHDYCQHAQALNMAVLVESHTNKELQRALSLPTPLMGVNNRSLHSFVTDLTTSIELIKNIPSDKLMITESGILTNTDMLLLQHHGIHHFLIGEALMRAKNIGEKLKELQRTPQT